MARILAKGLFDDETKVEFVLQDPAARIPNVTTGKVDITIQFMTVTPNRAQLVNFTRPYYIEGVALLSQPGSPREKWAALQAGGADTKISILQNVDAESGVHEVLPQAAGAAARHAGQRDPGAGGRPCRCGGRRPVDGAVAGQRKPDKYVDAGIHWHTMLYGAAMRQGDLDWLHFVNTTLNVGDVRPSERASSTTAVRGVLRPEAAGAPASACPVLRSAVPMRRGPPVEVELPFQLQPDLAEFRQARLGLVLSLELALVCDRDRHRDRARWARSPTAAGRRGSRRWSRPMSSSSATSR